MWLAVAVGAALRFLGLGGPSLWIDEALSARAAALPPAAILAAAAGDLHPPGYYLLLHGWTEPFRSNAAGLPGEWALRSLSAAASLAVVPILFWLGHAWAADPGRRQTTARAAAWVAALSPYAIALGREARMYALLSLLLAAQLALWTRLREGGGGPAAWMAVALVAAAGMYVHYHALLFTAALGAASWLPTPVGSRRFAGRFTLAAGAALLLFAPWLPRVLEQAAGGVRDWLPFAHSPIIIPRTLAAFVRGDGATADELALWMVPVAFLIWRGVRRGGGAPGLLLFLPLGIAYAASFAVNLFEARYFGGTAVVAWLLVARGAAAIRPRRSDGWSIAAAAMLLVALGIGIARGSSERVGRGEDWRELVQAVEAASPRGARVLFPFPEPLAPFAYYARPGTLALAGAILPGDEGQASLAPGLVEALRSPGETPSRVWWVPYLESLYDPGRIGRTALSEAGFAEGTPIHAGALTAIPFHPDGATR